MEKAGASPTLVSTSYSIAGYAQVSSHTLTMNYAQAGNKETFNSQYSDKLLDQHDKEQDARFAAAEKAPPAAEDGQDSTEKRRIVVVLFRNDLRWVPASFF